jgi:Proteobacterial transcriptional regulator-like domain
MQLRSKLPYFSMAASKRKDLPLRRDTDAATAHHHMKPPWLPDWRGAYPDTKKASAHQWAWEFLRRNPEYQRLWEKVIKPTYKCKTLEREKHSGPILAFKKKFHIMATDLEPLPSPSEDEAKDLSFDAPFILLRAPDGRGPIEFPCAIEQNEMLVFFNLSWPILPQLALVKEALIQAERAEHQAARFRRRANHYPTYLRLLDAKAAGVGTRELVETLYAKLSNANALQTMRDHFRAAKRLRDKDFWLIALTAQK